MAVLDAFLNPLPMEETKKVVISKRFVGEDGKPVPFVIRTITNEENIALNKKCRRVEFVRGQRYESFDSIKYQNALIVACTVTPDFRDADLCKRYGTFDPLDVPSRMLNAGETGALVDAIMRLNNLLGQDVEEIEDEAKNS